MPLFGFLCEDCNTEHELLVRGDAKPACPDCGSERLTKHLSAFAPMKGASKAETNFACGSPACCRLDGRSCGMN